ncbi:hypothetical protein BKA56DRAFT_587349, partial [Ilyonectria sp. MPI-CAGE-AT-0026]
MHTPRPSLASTSRRSYQSPCRSLADAVCHRMRPPPNPPLFWRGIAWARGTGLGRRAAKTREGAWQ